MTTTDPAERVDAPADVEAPEAVERPTGHVDPAEARRDAERAMARRRKRLRLWGIPFSLVALAIAAKLLSMVIVGQVTVGHYAESDYEGSLNSAQQQKILNVIERWKAPYDTGTSYLQLGLNDEARLELETALGLAVGADQCPVRSNLAIAIERQGDTLLAAGDPEGARAQWIAALDVLAQSPPECPDTTSGPIIQESTDRITLKLNPPQSSEPSQEPPTDPQEDQQTEDDLQDQLEDNQQDREDLLEDGGPSGGGTDRPW